MMDTADSKIRRASWTIIKKLINNREIEDPVLPRRVIRRCPAIIFAASRTAKVPGRIIFLTVSMQTIKGISAGGVP